jgi:uncharacterized protein YrrD
MSIKATHVIGLPVITANTGAKLDTVRDVMYDPGEQKVIALLVDPGGWFSDAKVILNQDINSIGPDAVMVASEGVVKKASQIGGKVLAIAKQDTNLLHTKVITEKGEELGSVSDLLFDPGSGSVTELEVSQGALKDVTTGKHIVRIGDIATVGEDAMIVTAATAIAFESQDKTGKGGLQGTWKKTTEKAKETLDDLSQQAKEKAQEVQQNPQVQQVQQTLKEKFEQAKEYVQSGQAQTDVQQRLNEARDWAQKTVQQVQEKGQNVVQQGQKTVQQKTTEAQTAIQNQRKQAALGKIVELTLFDRQDQVIAQPGDVVNHAIIQKAEAGGVLENLLNNVKKPEGGEGKSEEVKE